MAQMSRCWFITLNFKVLSDYEDLAPEVWEHCVFAVWQHEVGEQGTEHLQGYVHFSQNMRKRQVLRQWGLARARVRPRAGSRLQCLDYVTKEETRLSGPYYWPTKATVERQCRVTQGSRTDVKALCEMVQDGLTNEDIAANSPWFIVKYHKGIDALRLASDAPGRLGDEIDSVVYVGVSGTGKSRRLRLECPPGKDWFWVSPGKWFDGYEGQPGLVFDEFRDSWMTYSYFLKLVDKYPFKVERKGAVMEMRAFRFRFSTNVHPIAWWPNVVKPDWLGSPLERRLLQIVLMNEVYAQAIERRDDALAWWQAQPQPAPPAARAVFGQRMED